MANEPLARLRRTLARIESGEVELTPRPDSPMPIDVRRAARAAAHEGARRTGRGIGSGRCVILNSPALATPVE